MPVAAVNEHHGMEARKNEVRTTGQRAVMQPVSKSDFVKRPSQQQFDAGIFLSDARHDLRSGLTIDRVHSNLDNHMCGFQSFQMPVQTARRSSTSEQDAGLHVFLHGVASQIGARNETEILVGHGHLRVDLAFGKDLSDQHRAIIIGGLDGIGPNGALEDMIAAQMLACHDAAMECYAVAMTSQTLLVPAAGTLKPGRQALSHLCNVARRAQSPSAHHWARELIKLGHDARMMPPAYIKPYVRRQKNDAADAARICEAVTRPSMRFAGVRTLENQAALMREKSENRRPYAILKMCWC
jgi:hypothetical protein